MKTKSLGPTTRGKSLPGKARKAIRGDVITLLGYTSGQRRAQEDVSQDRINSLLNKRGLSFGLYAEISAQLLEGTDYRQAAEKALLLLVLASTF
jgi:hypothetical protein